MQLDYRLILDPLAPIGHLRPADQRRVCDMRVQYQLAMASQVGASCSHVEEIVALIGPRVVGLEQEHAFLLLLDANLCLVCEPIVIFKGTQDSCDFEPRAVLRAALARPTCAAFAMCHNHPSGSVQPSDADISVTRRMAFAAREIGLRFIDHLVVCGPQKYVSLRIRNPELFM